VSDHQTRRDFIELRALNPDGDLACDTTIATPEARARLDGLRSYLRPPVRSLSDGIEATFPSESWDIVQRYVELESQCCGFLTLRAEQRADAVVLTITGRPGAKPWIDQIFA
jgi:hypothetical protein